MIGPQKIDKKEMDCLKQRNQTVPANDAYSAQNSIFSHTKEYIILTKIH